MRTMTSSTQLIKIKPSSAILSVHMHPHFMGAFTDWRGGHPQTFPIPSFYGYPVIGVVPNRLQPQNTSIRFDKSTDRVHWLSNRFPNLSP